MVVSASFAESEKSAYHRVHAEQTGLSITRTLVAAPLHV